MAIVTTFLEPGTDATQDLTFWSSTVGTVASATDQFHTGPRSLKLSSTGATARSVTGVCVDSGTQTSFWFFTDSLPASAAATFFSIADASNLSVLVIQLNTTGTLHLNPVGATGVDGTAVLAINTWYRISLSYYITNTTTYQAKLYVSSVLDATANAGTLTRTGTDRISPSRSANFGGTALWYDDFYVATGGASSGSQPDTGNILVTAKRPNANGTTNGFTTQIGAGGSGYGSGHSPQVNEQPLSTTNGWSIAAVSAVTEEYNIEGAATGDVDISASLATIVDYIGWVFTSALLAETGSIIVNGASSNISITTSNALFIKAAGSTTYPAGTGTDIGEITSTTVTTVSLYECGIIFAYKAVLDTMEWYPRLPIPQGPRVTQIAY